MSTLRSHSIYHESQSSDRKVYEHGIHSTLSLKTHFNHCLAIMPTLRVISSWTTKHSQNQQIDIHNEDNKEEFREAIEQDLHISNFEI